ncbi:MAG: phytanoyl-CoA dioxygenase, partial [Pseudomonadota bacterium]
MTLEEIEAMYARDGYAAPIDVFSPEEIGAIRAEIEAAEARWGDELSGAGRNNAHYVLPVLDRVAHDPRILDAVERLIGHDIVVGGTT